MRKVFLALLLVLLAPIAAHADYYVCPAAGPCPGTANGSDSANGTSIDTPFATLTKARDTMRTGQKKTQVMGGTYTLSANLAFTSSDNSTAWVAYPGSTPIIRGGSSAGSGNFGITMASGTTGMVFKGLTFQFMGQGVNNNGGIEFSGDGSTITNTVVQYNTFKDCTAGCLSTFNLSGLLVDSNIFSNSISTTRDTGSGLSIFGGNNIVASHNYCENMGYGCVATTSANGSTSTTQHDITFDGNVTINNCLKVYYVSDTFSNLTDCGAIYMGNRVNTALIYNTNNKIINNVVLGGTGSQTGWDVNSDATSCIYLDDIVSGIDISGNLCLPSSGSFAIHFHGNQNVTVHNNVFAENDNGSGNLFFYQAQVLGGQSNNVMTGNTFQNNVVWYARNPPDPTWNTFATNSGGAAIVGYPAMSGNLWYMASGLPYRNNANSNFVDSSPVYCGPSMGGNLKGAAEAVKIWSSVAKGAIAAWLPMATNQGPTFRGCAAGQF